MKQALIKGAKSDEWYTPIETVKTMLTVFPPKAGDKFYCRSIQIKAILQKLLNAIMIHWLYTALMIF